jgi:hypothetical protein
MSHKHISLVKWSLNNASRNDLKYQTWISHKVPTTTKLRDYWCLGSRADIGTKYISFIKGPLTIVPRKDLKYQTLMCDKVPIMTLVTTMHP